MHNSCILTSSEAVTFAWIKKYLNSMKNQLKIDLYLLKIDYEINFVMEQTSVIAEKMSFFKDTYCICWIKRGAFLNNLSLWGLKALTKSLSSFRFRFNFILHSEKGIDTYSNFKVCINWLTWALFIIWIYKQAQCKGHHVPLCAVVVPPTDGNIFQHFRSPKIWTIATKTKVRISRSINCKLW